MRALMLNYEYPPLGGVAGNATAALLREFAQIPELEIDLATSAIGEARTEFFSENIRIHFLDIGKRGGLHYQTTKDLLTYSWRSWREARRMTRQKPYDLCHAFFGIPCGYVASKLDRAVGGGLPCIVSLRGSDVPFYNDRFRLLDRLLFRRLSRRIWSRAAAVVANSEGLRELALRTAPGQAVQVIPNGVDTTRFTPSKRNETNGLKILCVSRLIERKGVEYLIRAVAKLPEPRPSLTLAGTGNIEAELKRLASELGLASTGDARGGVRFLGQVAPEDIAGVYRAHDLFALPSLNEGMSNTVLEAMASGLPVIATETGGTAELLADGQNGFIIEKRSPEDIAEKIKRYLDKRELLVPHGENSRERAEKMSWKNAAAAYYELYEGVMSRKTGGLSPCAE